MRRYAFEKFGIENLRIEDVAPPKPGPGEVLLDVKAISLNFRDVMVVKGLYNPRLRMPAVPISDAAGVIAAVGEGVQRVRVGDRVTSHFIAGWIEGPFRAEYSKTSLGTPGPGLAAEQAVLPADAVVKMVAGYTFSQASTLPIAALTAWSSLVTEGKLEPGQTILTLGTGGVSIFALQLGKALGARVIITSSSDEKLERARELGADVGINYLKKPDWENAVLENTGGVGVDITVETGGAKTLDQSMQATRGAGVIALLGALTGIKAEVTTGLILMRRLHISGIYVDSRATFERMNTFIEKQAIKPVIGATFHFDELPEAFRTMEAGRHFGKIVVEI